jgi:hypothetical protein
MILAFNKNKGRIAKSKYVVLLDFILKIYVSKNVHFEYKNNTAPLG